MQKLSVVVTANSNNMKCMTITKHKTITIHTCVDASKMDGQQKKQSLHDYFSSQSKKTKSSEKGSMPPDPLEGRIASQHAVLAVHFSHLLNSDQISINSCHVVPVVLYCQMI